MAANTPSRGPPESPPSPPIVWDGDKMFNVYIWDYCTKRGFKKTADQLREEAGLEADSVPPINAKQGFLFEWWSVFWMLFGAKNNQKQDEDALLYSTHQKAVADARQRGPPAPPGARYVNGGVQQRPGPPQMQNGVTPNGLPAGPPVGASNGIQPPVGFPGMPIHANGAPGHSGASGVPVNQTNMQALPMQRPPPGGMPMQQRAPNGAPFQSPTLAPSPQSQAGQPPANQPPMSGLNPPPGHRGPMPPPNGPGFGFPRTPQPSGQPLGRSPSQPGSPAPGSMIAQSPSLSARMPPSGLQQGGLNDEALKNEMMSLPPALVSQAKHELSLTHKSPEQLTTDEKSRIVASCKQKAAQNRVRPQLPGQQVASGFAGPSIPMAGPSNPSMQPPMTPRAAQPGIAHPQSQQNLMHHQPQQQRPVKRSSTSPGQEPAQLPRNESSPPDRKRPRRSPPNSDPSQPGPPMTPLLPGQGQYSQQLSGGPPPPMGNSMMMSRPPMSQYPGQQGMPGMNNNPRMTMTMGQPMGNPTNPSMMHQGQPGAMTPQMQEQLYKQSMVNLHKSTMPAMMTSGNAASPSAVDGPGSGFGQDAHQRPGTGQYAPGGPGGMPGLNRMVQNKPMGPPPPPSPSLNIKKEGTDGVAQNGSPHVAAGQPQTQPSGAPPQGGQHGPPTPNPMGNMLSTPPASMMNTTSASLNQSQSSTLSSDPLTSLFNFETIDASAFGDLDTTFMDRPDAPDFERDFGQWFNSDSVNPLDSK